MPCTCTPLLLYYLARSSLLPLVFPQVLCLRPNVLRSIGRTEDSFMRLKANELDVSNLKRGEHGLAGQYRDSIR